MANTLLLTNQTIVAQSSAGLGIDGEFAAVFQVADLGNSNYMSAANSFILSFLNHEGMVSLGIRIGGSAVATSQRDPAVSTDVFSNMNGNFNFSFVRGDYYQREFQVINQYSGDPESISGTQFRLAAKWSYDDADADAIFVLTTENAGITINDGTNGRAYFTITPTHTSSLPNVSAPPLSFVYDLQWLPATSQQQTVLRGKVTLLPDVAIATS